MVAAARWMKSPSRWGDRSLAAYRKFIKNLTSDNIIKRTVVTRWTNARHMRIAWSAADVHGVCALFHQTGGHRPTPDLRAIHRPGVERFYLWTVSTSGRGVYGAGRATAIRMFEHLGMDFDKLVGAGPEKASAKGRSVSAAIVSVARAVPGKRCDERPQRHAVWSANEDLLVIHAMRTRRQ